MTEPTPDAATDTLPSWARELRDRYLAGEASLFLLHGNVRDLQPWVDGSGRHWVGLDRFLERFLARTRDVLVRYDVARGLGFPDASHRGRFERMVDARRTLEGLPSLPALPDDVPGALEAIEALITDPTQRAGVVLDFFEMIAPRADAAFMTLDDKAARVRLRRWASDPAVLSTDNLVIMVAESLSDLAPDVVSSPQLVTLSVPFPEADTRRAWIDDALAGADGDVALDMAPDVLADVTAGLTLLQLRGLVQTARRRTAPLDFATIARRKKEIVERECRGLVELVEPGHDLSHVGGMDEVVTLLRKVSADVRAGRRQQVPMGMIFVGPMGTGKTFVAEAFAAASGLTCLTLKSFRDRWVGSTEANLEKVLELIEALGYVLLIIDEAERALATGDSDGGTNSRVIARLKQFMSDTSHRGRVVVLMMTNRPDKLDVDLKRPGRFDLKIPFFHPPDAETREDLLAALVRKNRIALADDAALGAVAAATAGHSGAELEAVLLAAVRHAADRSDDGAVVVGADDLAVACEDTIPSRDVRMLAFMEMLAVFECSARKMLPEQYRDLPTDEVVSRLDRLRADLGPRAR